jgi:hypothetical protein
LRTGTKIIIIIIIKCLEAIPVSKHRAVNAYSRVEIKPHAFSISAVDGAERSASRSGCSAPEKGLLVPVGLEVGLTPEPVRSSEEKIHKPYRI